MMFPIGSPDTTQAVKKPQNHIDHSIFSFQKSTLIDLQQDFVRNT